MNRLIILIAFISISVSIFAQKKDFGITMRIGGKSVYPELVLKIDSIEVRLDSITAKKINPVWIKQIAVIKDEKYKELYVKKDGIVLIYPKKRFERKIMLLLAQSNDLILNSNIKKQIKNNDFIIKTGIGFDNYKIDTTSLLKVIADFGNSYDLIFHEKSSIFEFKYEKFGLSFYFYELRGNALLDCIVFNKPFSGITDTGIKLGASTMLDVKNKYGDLDWYSTNTADYWWSEYPGIEFGVEREFSLPRYPLDEELHEKRIIVEIIILNEDEY
jgi:hypothetical protein